MGFIREPEGVDFTVIPWEMTDEERKQVSAYIAKRKLEVAKILKRREAAAAKRAAAKIAKQGA